MIFYILKPLVYIVFRIFFRKMYYYNRSAIPKDRAILFAVNHPTAFLDPIFVASYMQPTTSFLLRGDVFKSPFLRWLLNQIHTIPIYRFRDGFTNLKNNQDSFNRVYELLHNGKHVLVLAEGETKHEKRLRPIQKGTARLVTGLYELYPDTKLCILPVGVNYTDSNQMRSEIMAAVGTPIMLEDYLEIYKENPRKAVKQMTDEITRQLKDSVIHIDKDEDAPFVNRILDFKRNDRNAFLLPSFSSSNIALDEEMKTVRQLNDTAENRKSELNKKVKAYDALLAKNGLEDVGVARSRFYSFVNTLILFLGLPIFLLGYLNNWLPFTLGKKVADAKVKKPAFYGSVQFGVILVAYFIMFTLAFLILLIIGSMKWLLLLFTLPVAGYLSLIYSDLFKRWNAARKWKGTTATMQQEIIALRKEILSEV